MDTITVTRNLRKELEAKNEIDLGIRGEKGERVLTISTYKSSRGLLSTASVSEHSDGCQMHVFGLAGGGDYRKTLTLSPNIRATEKAVRLQHEQALALAPTVIEEAKAHYARAST